MPLPEGQDLENLERRPASPGKRAATDKAEPDYFHLHTELKRKGITLRLLWEGIYRNPRFGSLPL